MPDESAPDVVLVVHGAGAPRRRRGRVYWETMLKEALGPEYVVTCPLMLNPDEPSYQAWAGRIAAAFPKTGSPILVGHSLGGSVLVKILTEQPPVRPVAGLFLVAGS